jgi:SAM-dependent methyltransferase
MVQELWIKLIRFGFRLLYNELAWTYDAVSWLVSLGHWRQWQRAALPFVMGQRVLEIGHGPGHMLAALRAQGVNVIGLDLSPFMGQMARQRFRRLPATPITCWCAPTWGRALSSRASRPRPASNWSRSWRAAAPAPGRPKRCALTAAC